MNEAKAIREELSYIGRYQDGISPKLEKWQELENRKQELRKKLKTLKDNTSGVNHGKMKKPRDIKRLYTKDLGEPIVGKNIHNIHPRTRRTFKQF